MEKLLHLFNTLWFERRSLPLETIETMTLESVADQSQTVSDVGLTRLISHGRSSSDQQLDVLNMNANALSSDAESPKSVLGSRPKLETVVSGKEFEEKVVKEVADRWRRMKRKKKNRSKSLTEMEFEEVKGFMDLGFVFSEEDCKDSRLVLMIPGLQILGCEKREEDGICVKRGRTEKIARWWWWWCGG